MSMTKITMKLGLNDAATEDNVISEIKKIEDRAYVAETATIAAEKSLSDIENAAKKIKADADIELGKVKNELAEKITAFDKVKAEYDAMLTDKLAAEEVAKEIMAKNMVEGYAKAGRIKNEASVILKWATLAKNDFEGTEGLIKELPLNKSAVVIATENKLGEGELPTNALALAVRNKLKREGKI